MAGFNPILEAAAMILNPRAKGKASVKEFTARTGIPAGTPEELMPSDMHDTYRKLSAALWEDIGVRLNKEGGLDTPLNNDYIQYVSPNKAAEAMNEGHLSTFVDDLLVNSRQFASDVAQILSARSIK